MPSSDSFGLRVPDDERVTGGRADNDVKGSEASMIRELDRIVLTAPVPEEGLEAANVRPVGHREITHARELAAS